MCGRHSGRARALRLTERLLLLLPVALLAAGPRSVALLSGAVRTTAARFRGGLPNSSSSSAARTSFLPCSLLPLCAEARWCRVVARASANSRKFKSYKEGTAGSRADPVLVAKSTQPRALGGLLAQRLRKFGEMYAQSMGSSAMFAALTAPIYTERKMRNQLQVGGSWGGQRLIVSPAWKELPSSADDIRRVALETRYRFVTPGTLPAPFAGDLAPLRVSAETNPEKLATSIATWIEQDGVAIVMAIGAGPVAKAIRAILIANRDYLGDGREDPAGGGVLSVIAETVEAERACGNPKSCVAFRCIRYAADEKQTAADAPDSLEPCLVPEVEPI